MKPIDDSTSKPTGSLDSDHHNNPFHTKQMDFPFSPEETGALGALRYEVDDLVKLELAAEKMVVDEVDLAKAYINEDAQGVWLDLKGGLYQWELITSEWLLSAADPTRVDWQLHHWWGDDETHLH
jgi:hypothetical protein